ncbi:hypothetical protein K469DRAFT_724133 [Zopfia rhizophila CBS 207.26]|uniref:RNase H type-1 domain-containing protein n=1 Tax=Zopfia rhizophila CBS 207.26 TaxID=1314779 RepID=A0A6A6DBT3_9PEZI|nr:hypothetical protein K469DRAFT_724133 [Zopfia rhizophila CBS 207.26]
MSSYYKGSLLDHIWTYRYIDNPDRGLRYIPFNIRKCLLFVFVDGSFANNKDMSSQLGFLIIIRTESRENNSFELTGNIMHYSSTKSKRVTRSVLVSEIYGMVSGVDMAYAFNTTLNQIAQELNLLQINTIICTDSYSLYECLELYEIRWINGADNLADAFTKRNSNGLLKRFIDTNKAHIHKKKL